MSANWTQEYLDYELEHERIAKKELNDAIQLISTIDIMINVENVRKKLLEKYPFYTQIYVAKNAGISPVTYWNYLNGISDNIRWKTIQNIVHTLHCDFSDILKPADTEDEQD